MTILLFFCLSWQSEPPKTPASAPKADPTYWADIQPIFRKHCTACHSEKHLKSSEVSAGIALDRFDLMRQGKTQKMWHPGHSDKSRLLEVLLETDPEQRMPRDADPLSAAEIDLIKRWLDTGAMEGTPPKEVALAPGSTVKRHRPRFDLVLPTQFTPPPALTAGQAAKGRLELVAKAGPLDPITALAFSPDGQWLAVGSHGQVVLWALDAAQPKQVLTDSLGAVNDLKFNADGSLLAVAGGQPSVRGEIRLYNPATGQLVGHWGGHHDVVFTVAFHPKERKIASASFDRTVRVWDIDKQECLLEYTGHSDSVYAVAFTPDGQSLLTASKDRTLRKVQLATGKSELTFSGMSEDVMTVAVSPDGKQVISGGLDRGLCFWNAATAERIRLVAGAGSLLEVAYSPDGQWVGTAGADSQLRIWNAQSGALVRSMNAGSLVYAVAFHPDGKRIASGSFDGQVRLWDRNSGRLLSHFLAWRQDQGTAWLAYLPEGYWHGQTRDQVHYQAPGASVPIEQTHELLMKAEHVKKAVQGEAVPPVTLPAPLKPPVAPSPTKPTTPTPTSPAGKSP